MTTRATRTADAGQVDEGKFEVVTFDAVFANGDVGDGLLRLWEYSDRSVQVFGTFGTGGTVLIEGSNDGTNWATLNDAFGVALSITAASIKQITEVSKFVRPRCSAGDGTTALSVIFFLRRTKMP